MLHIKVKYILQVFEVLTPPPLVTLLQKIKCKCRVLKSSIQLDCMSCPGLKKKKGGKKPFEVTITLWTREFKLVIALRAPVYKLHTTPEKVLRRDEDFSDFFFKNQNDYSRDKCKSVDNFLGWRALRVAVKQEGERGRERVTCGTSWLFRNLTVGRCSEINDPSKVFEGWFYLLLFL